MIGATTFLEVLTLGRFEVRRNQSPLTGGNWSRRKVCDLFKVLLSAEQHRLHREQIQELLWPASTSEQAANSFGKTLYLLRRALEPGLAAGKGSASIYILLDHDTLMLIPGRMKIDADVFEASAKQLQAKIRSHSAQEQQVVHLLDEFDHVLALYGGEFLPEDLYEDWAQRRRDRLRRVHSWLLENAAELALASAKGQRACEYLQALLEHNSTDEQTHCRLMLTYARMGRRGEALNQYQLLHEALKEDLRANPLPETIELFRNIQAGRIAADLIESRSISGSAAEVQDVGTPLAGVSNRDAGHSGTGAQVHIHAHATADIHPAPKSFSPEHEVLPAPQVGGEHESRHDREAEPTASRQIDPDRILKAELVGREEEVRRLQRAYNQARNGQRRVVFISGEPGIGKTRLAREYTRWAEETQHATVLWGYCYEMSGLLPYQPIADAISTHARTCSPEQLRSMLGNSAVDLAKIAPEVRTKLPELPQPEPLGPEMERRNLYNAVARFFQALAAERPLIIILDDLQWADAATVHLLNFLTLQGAGTSPFDTTNSINSCGAVLLYLMLYRADEVHEAHPLRGLIASLARSRMGEELRPQRLTEEQVQQLLVNMAGHFVQPIFAGEVYRQTEGNPFFIGEVIRSLIFEGKIKWTGERWQATVKVDELEIPQSVRLVIERRLLALSADCRTTLALAAVLGREFSSALLCQARNLSEDIVAEHLDNAIQAQLISPLFEAPAGQGTSEKMRSTSGPLGRHSLRSFDLTFTHDKIREVLYQWLNPLRKRTLHRQVGQAIEARYANRLQPYYSTLAYHYQMAEDSARAVDYLLRAAQLASSVYAFEDAADYIKNALELLISDEERPSRAALLRQLTEIYLYTGYLEEAIAAGLASATLWRDLGEVAKEADARLYVAFCYHWQGREVEAIEHIKHALKCLETQPGETYLLAKAYTQWGLAGAVMGDVPLARDKLQQADALSAQLETEDAFISIVSLWSRSWCAFLAESPQKMLEYALQSIEVCRRLCRPDWEPMQTYSAAWAYMLLGRLKEGDEMARDSLKKAQQHGVVGAQGWANLVLAFLAIQAGRWEEAQEAGDKAYAIATMLYDADLQSRVLWSRSVCSGWRGEWGGAVADILEALHIARRAGETSMTYPYLLVQAAKSYFYDGKLDKAQKYLDEAMQLARSRQYYQLPAIGQRLQGRILQAHRKFAEAQPYFEQSLATLEAIDDQVEYARTQETYGDFYLARNQPGDAERGQALIESAKATFRRLGVNG